MRIKIGCIEISVHLIFYAVVIYYKLALQVNLYICYNKHRLKKKKLHEFYGVNDNE